MTDTPTAPTAKPHRRTKIFASLIVLGLAACAGAVGYLLYQQQFVYSDKAEISAPLIALTPLTPGALKKVYVKEGDTLDSNQTVARVGDELLTTQVKGVAVVVKQDIGANYSPGQAVVTMIEPKELKVVARIEEDKGLKDVYVGQTAKFSVDAFPGKSYDGTVDTISETSRTGDVVFNISDKRQTNQFDVKILYDTQAYPELQNGMSAKVWIVK